MKILDLFHCLKSKKAIYFMALALLVSACGSDKNQKVNLKNDSVIKSTFVGSATCQSCHQQEFESWEGSHHDQAMKIADSESILADFDNSTFTHQGVKSTFFKRDTAFFVNTEGPDGKFYDYKIIYTFGVTPLQQYIVKFPNGEYQCLVTAWDTEKKKWFHLQPDLELKHEEWLHWTKGGMRWNTMCADCHSTNVHKNFDRKLESYNTTYSEINVGCESCHGPSSTHVDFYQNPDANSSPPKLHMDSSLTSVELVNKCARCHSRRSQITNNFDFDEHFLDHYSPRLLVDPVYEPDGQIRDEDYVYGSFIQSKMYQNGVACNDCHDVHSLKLKEVGNTLCMSCHEPKYNEISHHFHELETEGAQCISCHMTGKTYMGNDFRRDHSFRVPRPDQSVAYGTPNACNGCHQDKSADWAADFIKSKYGDERAEHFSDYLLAGFHGDNAAYQKLMSNEKFPKIARATALSQYQVFSVTEVNEIKKYLIDSSPLMRNEAVIAFENLGSADYAKFVEPLLMDSLRMVRISAARFFNTIGVRADSTKLKLAKKEYLAMLRLNADFASGQHQIALYHVSNNNPKAAIMAYKKAIEIDNFYNTSRMNLALMLYQNGKVEEAEQLYLKVTEQEPDFGYSYYMLGLLYNETNEPEKALKYLGLACEREPINVRACYNYALKLQEAKRFEESVVVIDKVLIFNPINEEFLYVKLIAQLNGDQQSAAKETCKKLLNIAPANENYGQIWERLNQPVQ